MSDLNSQSSVIQTVYGWYNEDKLQVNRRYQRKLVWTLEEKRMLIDSILKKYPIPAIFIAEKEGESGSYEIIDGLQRLQAIMSFIELEFSTSDGRYFNITRFPTAKEALDKRNSTAIKNDEAVEYISKDEVTDILDYSLAISFMRNATEVEVNDVFDRINTFGRRLSDQERRQAGVQNNFGTMVRKLACNLRGDETSAEVLPLRSMPSISIDLPTMKHGYQVQASDVFWVSQGILRSTDLRDSLDEQCIADVAACIVGGKLIERSKQVLDKIYDLKSPEAQRIQNALAIYGADKFFDEFKYCVNEIIKVCEFRKSEKLRNIIFERRTTNAFPSVFAVLLIAFHELIVKEKKKISDYAGIKDAITNLASRVDRGRKATSPDERQKNVNQIKGLIQCYFVAREETEGEVIYQNHQITDIETAIRRSEVELPDYELKQGLLSLDDSRAVNEDLLNEAFIETICAIANNGPKRTGKILIGIADKEDDAKRIEKLDSIRPQRIGNRWVVGIRREATCLNISVEEYLSQWRNAISNSELPRSLKDSVLSHIDYNEFYGLGVIVITIPSQKSTSYIGKRVCIREGDTTQCFTDIGRVLELSERFKT